jgi:repressor LexA
MTRLPAAARPLTQRQRAMLDCIIEFKARNDGNPPTFREIGDASGITSMGLVQYHLHQLIEKGYIRMSDDKKQRICVVGGRWSYEPMAESGVAA